MRFIVRISLLSQLYRSFIVHVSAGSICDRCLSLYLSSKYHQLSSRYRGPALLSDIGIFIVAISQRFIGCMKLWYSALIMICFVTIFSVGFFVKGMRTCMIPFVLWPTEADTSYLKIHPSYDYLQLRYSSVLSLFSWFFFLQIFPIHVHGMLGCSMRFSNKYWVVLIWSRRIRHVYNDSKPF
jgi:hypothetical protein